MSRWRSEAGESLLEVLMSTLIMGLLVAGIVAGIGAATRMSNSNRDDAEAFLMATRAAEAVKSVTGVSCVDLSPATFATALDALDLPEGWDAGDVVVENASCAPLAGVMLPQVRVRATAPGGGSRSFLVVPRSA